MKFDSRSRVIFSAVLTLILCFSTASSAQSASPSGATGADDSWHVAATPYLWFVGAHGTAGVGGVSNSFHASFGDLLSNLDIGVMGQIEARKKKFILSDDLLFAKFSHTTFLPVNELGINSIKLKATLFLLTPKVGYRVVDKKMVKVDAQLGLRYWHLGQSLNLQPQLLNGLSASQNWADVVAGGRIQVPLSPKATVTILGDAGGGGAQQDYQVVGLLGYKVSQKCVLQGGWRYLSVDYRGNRNFIFDTQISGVVLGATFNLK